MVNYGDLLLKTLLFYFSDLIDIWSESDTFMVDLGMLCLNPTTLNLHLTNFKSTHISFDFLMGEALKSLGAK